MRRLRFLAPALAVCLGLCSCAAYPRHVVRHEPREGASPGLVLPHPSLSALTDDDFGWEVSRNEPPRERAGTREYRQWRWLEVRHREHLRTINGRPSEFSTTTTRSIQRGLRR